ncbi:hypothetical protein N7523_002228 [Penicillium sp. IBT 18751x]|nr:hypothetical protein N7523_002228 [Penicillium sp. IBT 18751x]
MVSFMDHQYSPRDFILQDIILRTGTGDDALAPVNTGSKQRKDTHEHESFVEVPVVFSPSGDSQHVIQLVTTTSHDRKTLRRVRLSIRGKLGHLQRLLPSSEFR